MNEKQLKDYIGTGNEETVYEIQDKRNRVTIKISIPKPKVKKVLSDIKEQRKKK